MHPFSIQEALWFGWHKTRSHSRLVFQVVLTLFALQVASAMVQKVLEGTPLGFLALVVLGVLSVFLSTGAMQIALTLARGERAYYRNLLPAWSVVWRFFATGLLVGVAIVVGLVLLIVPGIYLALRFSMARFAVLDGAGILESLRTSTRLTHGVRWKLLGFFLALLLLNLVGAVLLLVGLLITLPVSTFAYAHVYLKLKSRTVAS